MQVETQIIAPAHNPHVVQFYEHDQQLTDAVVPYLADGLSTGETVFAIATEPHLRAFARGLEGTATAAAARCLADRLIALDAASTLSALTVEGEIDAAAFARVIATPIRRAVASGRSVRVYGEMVSLLWQAGEVLTAIRLEELWNELAGEYPFALFCSYAAASMEGSEHGDALRQVCALHSSVLPVEPERDVRDGGACSRELTSEFSAGLDAPGRARRLAVAALRRWGIEETLVDEAALVLSELANNAVIHARTPFSIAIDAQEPVLRIAVADMCPCAASGEEASLVPRLGHGLGVIEALSSAWGVEGQGEGKIVWAELRGA